MSIVITKLIQNTFSDTSQIFANKFMMIKRFTVT